MNGTYPLTINYRIDDTYDQKFENLSPNHVLHLWVQPSLMINNWFSIGLEIDSMLANGWTNTLEIIKSLACLRSVSNNRSSSYPEWLELIITGYTFFSSK